MALSAEQIENIRREDWHDPIEKWMQIVVPPPDPHLLPANIGTLPQLFKTLRLRGLGDARFELNPVIWDTAPPSPYENIDLAAAVEGGRKTIRVFWYKAEWYFHYLRQFCPGGQFCPDGHRHVITELRPLRTLLRHHVHRSYVGRSARFPLYGILSVYVPLLEALEQPASQPRRQSIQTKDERGVVRALRF